MLYHVEAALQVDVEDAVPIRLFHAQDEFIRRDARVVDEDVDLSEIFDDLIDDRFGRRKIGNVAGIIAGGDACRRQGGKGLRGGFRRGVVHDGDIRVFFGEGERDLRADAPARARDERDSLFVHICSEIVFIVTRVGRGR